MTRDGREAPPAEGLQAGKTSRTKLACGRPDALAGSSERGPHARTRQLSDEGCSRRSLVSSYLLTSKPAPTPAMSMRPPLSRAIEYVECNREAASPAKGAELLCRRGEDRERETAELETHEERQMFLAESVSRSRAWLV